MSVRSSSLQFSSLPPELVTIVAEQLDTRSLANFAAASTACLAAAQNELRVALTAAVQRCLLPGRSCRGMDKLVASPHFRLPDDLVAIPAGAFMHCTSLTQLTIPATVATIGERAFDHCSSLTQLTLPVDGFTQSPTWHDMCGSDTCGSNPYSRCEVVRPVSLPLCKHVLCTACRNARFRSYIAPMRRVVIDLEPEEGVDAARPILLD